MSKFKVLKAYGERAEGEVFEATAEEAAPLLADGSIEEVSEDAAPANTGEGAAPSGETAGQ